MATALASNTEPTLPLGALANCHSLLHAERSGTACGTSAIVLYVLRQLPHRPKTDVATGAMSAKIIVCNLSIRTLLRSGSAEDPSGLRGGLGHRRHGIRLSVTRRCHRRPRYGPTPDGRLIGTPIGSDGSQTRRISTAMRTISDEVRALSLLRMVALCAATVL